ncbi:MAG: carbohydrate kinase family protein [Candidatus Kerfeldbacteria bacterium]|nr:carbohydrate kinase family protein [Candidatus Kerfeldbacteria bacterium]
MYDVITVGSATRDVFMRSRHIKIIKDVTFSTGEAECFALGSKLDVDYILFDTGGGATNTAVGFARQGLRTAFVGRIGRADVRGREVLRAIANEGVDTSLVVQDRNAMTAYSVILLTARGERTVLVFRGASAKFKPDELPRSRMRARWFYVTALGGNAAVVRAIFQQAARVKARVAWNPGAAELAWGYRRLLPFFKQSAVLLLNREEASSLLKVDYAHDRLVFEKLCFALPGLVVVTEGTKGAVVCDNERRYVAETHDIKVVDTTGAGDAFGCGFVGTYIQTDGDIRRALQFATANAESKLQHVGAKDGLLRRIPRRGLVRVRVSRFKN